MISEVRGDVMRGRSGEKERLVRKVAREEIVKGGKVAGMIVIVVEMSKK